MSAPPAAGAELRGAGPGPGGRFGLWSGGLLLLLLGIALRLHNLTNVLVGGHFYFVDADCLCIVMEYCASGTLAHRIATAVRQQVRLDEPTITSWLAQLALALQCCHNHRVLHRDLKSDNVYLTGDNQIRLGDFGVARDLGSGQAGI